jgi:hypothetical protein
MKDTLREDIVGFETAKLAKQAGYSNGTMLSYIYYNSTYVYDLDPDHPESYKKGVIRARDNFWTKNGFFNDIEHYIIDPDNPDQTYYKLNQDLKEGDVLWETFEAPSNSMLYKWIRQNYGIQITVTFVKPTPLYEDKPYTGQICYPKSITNAGVNYFNEITYEDCFEQCLQFVLNYIINKNK